MGYTKRDTPGDTPKWQVGLRRGSGYIRRPTQRILQPQEADRCSGSTTPITCQYMWTDKRGQLHYATFVNQKDYVSSSWYMSVYVDKVLTRMMLGSALHVLGKRGWELVAIQILEMPSAAGNIGIVGPWQPDSLYVFKRPISDTASPHLHATQ